MGKHIILIILAACMAFCSGKKSTNASDILSKSIAYHDPENEWPAFAYKLTFISQRPQGADRTNEVLINNNTGEFSNYDAGSRMQVVMDSCLLVPEGKTCDNVKRLRNYYVYLWGLPMKLTDKGTALEPNVKTENFNGRACFVLRVVYPEDTWYFYIDKESFALRGYLFYKGEPAKKGEVIYLEEEEKVGNMRIPKKRTWYTTPDNQLLGTDILSSAEEITEIAI